MTEPVEAKEPDLTWLEEDRLHAGPIGLEVVAGRDLYTIALCPEVHARCEAIQPDGKRPVGLTLGKEAKQHPGPMGSVHGDAEHVRDEFPALPRNRCGRVLRGMPYQKTAGIQDNRCPYSWDR